MRLLCCLICLEIGLSAAPQTVPPANPSAHASDWKIYVTNDACSDYTWGFNEKQTRQAFADVIKSHLDEMNQTDRKRPEDRDHYNLSITQEALAFLEIYPERKAEFVRRVKQGRISIGAFLNNNLWGFQSVESEIRSLYVARRMEEQWGVPITVAQHIEEPAMPWGAAAILSASGFRWLIAPFLDYDSHFAQLTNPPFFTWLGPDGSHIRVLMDRWASEKANYVQGRYLLTDPARIEQEWLPHYRQLGDAYPLRIIGAIGTHGDNSPTNGALAPGFAKSIIDYNSGSKDHATLVNSTLPQLTGKVDQWETQHPFLSALRGDFGISWDAWPVTLAKYAAAMRSGERAFLATETLMVAAHRRNAEFRQDTSQQHARAEWDLTMLADHAWNGTDDANRQVNAELRRKWGEELAALTSSLQRQAWQQAGLVHDRPAITVFNSLSFPRSELVTIASPDGNLQPAGLASQNVVEDGRNVLYFVSPAVSAFQFLTVSLERANSNTQLQQKRLPTSQFELDNALYHLQVDPKTGGIRRLIDKRSNRNIVTAAEHSLAQTLFFDGAEHELSEIQSQLVADGPVLSRLRVTGETEGIKVAETISIYPQLDRIDFDIQIHKPMTTNEQRLVQVFPVGGNNSVEHVETTGAIIRPEPQPEGDLLPGADPNRFAVQSFVDVSDLHGPGVSIAPLDSYLLRQDLGNITFEALGNDQNHKESTHDQHKETDFRFRYALQAHQAAYDSATVMAWSRSVATPLIAELGSLPAISSGRQSIQVDPRKALATAYKQADGQGDLLRLWEVAGTTGPLTIQVTGYRTAIRTDLLERDLEPLPIRKGRIILPIAGNGFSAVRLIP